MTFSARTARIGRKVNTMPCSGWRARHRRCHRGLRRHQIHMLSFIGAIGLIVCRASVRVTEHLSIIYVKAYDAAYSQSRRRRMIAVYENRVIVISRIEFVNIAHACASSPHVIAISLARNSVLEASAHVTLICIVIERVGFSMRLHASPTT